MKKPILSFVKAIGLLSIVVTGYTAKATNYYFSSSNGDDSRTQLQAQSSSTPWKSLEKLNAIFQSLRAGDSIFFKRGDVFTGTIAPSASGNSSAPIVLTAYGAGEQPVISGFQNVSGWKAVGGKIWEADGLSANELNVVLVNGKVRPVGRYPNEGYLSIDSYSGNSSITDGQLASGPNWNGGDVVIRKNRWILDRNKITNHSGNTVSYISESGYHASANYGYFIQNHPNTLDQEGEWYFQNRKIGVYISAGSPFSYSVQASVVPVLINLSSQSNLTFLGLRFTGANNTAFEIRNAQNITVANCSISYSGVNAIDASSTQGLKVIGTEIRYSNNVALNLTNCWSTNIQNNLISYTGSVAGMGKGGDGTYSAILLNGDNNLVEANTIEYTGYVPVSFNGSSVTIKNNFINQYTLVKDDGGGIYTWNNSSNPPNYTNRKIIGNIVLNGQTASAGTNESVTKFSHGIYIDDNAANVEIAGNTVANCEGFGLYIHNARDLAIRSNTAYNNTVQIAMVHDDIAANSPIRNTEVKNNIFFSLSASQAVAEYKTRRDDLQDFGSFDDNYYSRPVDENGVIGTLRNVNGSYIYQPVDVDGWKAMSGKDAASKGSPKTFSSFVVSSFLGNNKFSNGAFSSNVGGLYAFSPANNCQTSWDNNALDGGSLAVKFSSITNSSKGTVVIGIGAITAGKKYLLRFSLKGGNENKMLDIYLRKSGAPYNEITERKLAAVKANRKEIEILFTPTESTSDGSIGIDVPEHTAPVYFDNIELKEVAAADANIADSVKFVYNATANAASTPLALNYIDVKGMMYSGTASTSPYSSVILLAAVAGVAPPPATCSATGSILREQWDDLNGNDVKDIPQTTQPTSSSQLSLFETSSDIGDKFGARIRGYVCPPQTGNYTFFIAGDDATELWLSTSDDPAIKKKIGYNLNWTGLREWNKFSTQKSEPIFLEAGKKYYIEALHKEGNGGDHLSVAWQLPNGSMEAPIAGVRLSPFQMAPQLNQTISFAPLQSITLGDGTITLAASSSSGLPVSFSIVSGPATINGSVLTPTATGIVVVKASQAGNSQFGQAIDVMQQLSILPAVQCAATGSILREQWNGINGNDVAQIPLSILASSSGQLTQFEASQNVAENYGSRIRGYICAPQTGNYTFFIAGDDATELWLSSNESPTGKSRIAYNLSWTGFREWTKFGTQKSTTIYLEAGKKYYIEALHKEGSGGDHLSVAWQLPNGTFEAPIAGSRLSPWLNTTNEQCAATGFILREEWENIDGNDIAQIPQNSLSSSSSQITVFEGLTNAGNKYGSRIRGYICPPQTGNYTFFISGDDATELWLSANALISGRKKIAYNLSWTDFREWNKFSSQKSLPVYLEAGKKYYIEALHKEGNGGDHLSVAWQLPDGSMEAPISGNRLSPVLIDILSASKTMFSALDIGKELSVPVTNGNAQTLIAYPNPFNTKTTIEVNSPANGLVTIEVYDVSGRMIKKIFQREMTAKEKVRIDFSGSQLANGIYFLKLISLKGFEHFKLIKN